MLTSDVMQCSLSLSLSRLYPHLVRVSAEAYSNGPGVLFELLQNADDAGASEVAFMLDKVEYGTNSILGELPPKTITQPTYSLYLLLHSVWRPTHTACASVWIGKLSVDCLLRDILGVQDQRWHSGRVPRWFAGIMQVSLLLISKASAALAKTQSWITRQPLVRSNY